MTATARSPLAVVERDLRWALDPARFAREALGIEPDEWQVGVLRWQGARLALCCSRQSGKSTTTSVLAAHTSIYQPGSLTLLVSPSLRQSSELFRKVSGHLQQLERPPKRVEDNKLSYTLENGSRVVSLPSSEGTIRGFSAVDLLIEDEAAWVADALHKAVRPMLAVSQGRLVLMSSPFGKRGHFYEAWEQGGPSWDRVKVTAYQCPRISPAFLAEERAQMGELWFRSEYLCEFAETVDSAFSWAAVEATVSNDVQPLFGPGFGPGQGVDALVSDEPADEPSMATPPRGGDARASAEIAPLFG